MDRNVPLHNLTPGDDIYLSVPDETEYTLVSEPQKVLNKK